jgi:hypothetical protein
MVSNYYLINNNYDYNGFSVFYNKLENFIDFIKILKHDSNKTNNLITHYYNNISIVNSLILNIDLYECFKDEKVILLLKSLMSKLSCESFSQNELIRKGYDAASQKLKRDEEIRSLAPDTSVETKNKTVLNLQLYNWRQDAIAGVDKNNLYKLTFTADSSNSAQTGTANLSLNFYYVRLGHLLDWIQNNLLVYDNTKKFDPEAITFSPKNKPQTTTQNNKFDNGSPA